MDKRLFLMLFLSALLLLTACNNDQENYMGEGDPSAPEETEEPADSEANDAEEEPESNDSEETEESDTEESSTEENDSEVNDTEEAEDDAPTETEESALVLQLMENESLGEYLADSEGMTLYYFTDDAPETSNCADACLFNWPALIASDFQVPEGYEESDFGTITRVDDGEPHVTYKGYPLYYFRNDLAEGDVNGQGMNDAWYIVNDATQFPE